MKNIFARCGVNCGHCPAYKENVKTKQDRQFCSDGWAKYLGARLKPAICICEGCLSPDPWKSGNKLPMRGCILRTCVLNMDISNCAYCYFYPCQDLIAAIPGADFREKTEKRIGRKIPETDYRALIEPYEGLKNLAKIRKTLKSRDIAKQPSVEPLKTNIVDFSNKIKLSNKEIISYKIVHQLLKRILSAQANTYARQILIKKRIANILNLLWVFGVYGEIKDSHLVIDSKTVNKCADFTNIVRKRDNAFHIAASQSVRILKDFGVDVEFIPMKKDWLLKIKFAKIDGGTAAMKALRVYITKLVKKFGKPVYTGASKFKGKAFELFSKADMQIFGK
jgi:hypothetical protein